MAENTKVYNGDVVGIYDRLQRFMYELMFSNSAKVSGMSPHDIERSESYLNAILKYVDWVVAQPLLDLPESDPWDYALEAPVAVANVENESINDLVRLMVSFRAELINSQSARIASGLNKFDEKRVREITQKALNLINNYVKTTTPLDLPESSPMEAITGSGRQGI